MSRAGAEDLAPIVLAVEVPVGAEECYRRFTAGFGAWWPVATHSLSREAGTRCVLEAWPGGRVFEVAPGGAERGWGSVTVAEPGRLLRFTWHPGREAGSAQWIEVVFEPLPGGCRATLTHAGWETLGEIAPLLRREYVSGWRHVFGDLFARFASLRH